MSTRPARPRSRRRPGTLPVAVGLALAALAPAVASADGGAGRGDTPRLTGRAVLPVETYAKGAPAGAALVDSDADLLDGVDDGMIRGIQFPTPSQPVEGFSGIVEGRRPGEYLAMADNGFGNKANSADFDLRAYYLRPELKTAHGGSGAIAVKGFIEFRDPWEQFPHPIVNEGTRTRVLTGADVDPESIQRDHRGDLWVGDEFGPWILHFDAKGRLLEAPFGMPDGLVAATNPAADPDGAGPLPATMPIKVNGSRGIEAMAMSPDGEHLHVILEGAVIGDDPSTRRIYRFDLATGEWLRMEGDYRTDAPGQFVADAQAVDADRLLVIERDGAAATLRKVYAIDLRDPTRQKTQVVDLAAIPDPAGVSLPAIHPGDVGLGDPFQVMCESIEALRVVSDREVLLGCDNNFPNAGRNPLYADDSELITVAVPRL